MIDVIGLAGRKGSGKDTVGQYLVERYGYTRMSFAAPLKDSAAALFGIDAVEWETLKNTGRSDIILRRPDKESVRLTAREFLQRYGTEAHRDVFGQQFWTDQLIAQLRPGRKYVVTDARFENECRALREVGGRIVVIDRPGTDADDTHASETLPPEAIVDVWLTNDGTIEELQRAVDSYMHFQEALIA